MVYIATHRADLRLTRICVASIRRWYPSIPIFLLKDEANGSFDTSEIEQVWNVDRWPTSGLPYGWGFIKLQPFFDTKGTRFLMLDSDIVFLGRVIDALEKFDTDFVVQEESQPPEDVPRLYFDPARIRASLDPNFLDPPFTFNTGQYVGTSGRLQHEDFGDLVVWSNPRRVRYPEMFNPSDQGVLNFVVLERLRAGAISVARTPFMKWGREELSEFRVDALDENSPYPYLIHWAGLKHVRLRRMPRADILRHFERFYYSRISLGRARLYARIVADDVSRTWRRGIRLARRIWST